MLDRVSSSLLPATMITVNGADAAILQTGALSNGQAAQMRDTAPPLMLYMQLCKVNNQDGLESISGMDAMLLTSTAAWWESD